MQQLVGLFGRTCSSLFREPELSWLAERLSRQLLDDQQLQQVEQQIRKMVARRSLQQRTEGCHHVDGS